MNILKIILCLGIVGTGYADNCYYQMPFQKLLLKSPTELLLEAATQGNTVVIEQAIKDGADVNARDWAGLTPLMRAVQSCPDVEYITKLFLEAGADYAARDEQYCQCTQSHCHDAYYYARQRGIHAAITAKDNGVTDVDEKEYSHAFMKAVNNYTGKHGLTAFVSPFMDIATWPWIEE